MACGHGGLGLSSREVVVCVSELQPTIKGSPSFGRREANEREESDGFNINNTSQPQQPTTHNTTIMADKMKQVDTAISDADAIKTMKLYTHVDRIKTELISRNMTSPIDPIALSEIDSMHYLGNTAIQAAVDILSLDSSSRVLDVGSGFGGVSRMLSNLSGCQVTALELQQDIHELGQDLTKRCNISC